MGKKTEGKMLHLIPGDSILLDNIVCKVPKFNSKFPKFLDGLKSLKPFLRVELPSYASLLPLTTEIINGTERHFYKNYPSHSSYYMKRKMGKTMTQPRKKQRISTHWDKMSKKLTQMSQLSKTNKEYKNATSQDKKTFNKHITKLKSILKHYKDTDFKNSGKWIATRNSPNNVSTLIKIINPHNSIYAYKFNNAAKFYYLSKRLLTEDPPIVNIYLDDKKNKAYAQVTEGHHRIILADFLGLSTLPIRATLAGDWPLNYKLEDRIKTLVDGGERNFSEGVKKVGNINELLQAINAELKQDKV